MSALSEIFDGSSFILRAHAESQGGRLRQTYFRFFGRLVYITAATIAAEPIPTPAQNALLLLPLRLVAGDGAAVVAGASALGGSLVSSVMPDLYQPGFDLPR